MEDLVIETGSEKKKFALLPENYYTVSVDKATVKEQSVYMKPTETEKVIDFEFTVLDDKTYTDPELGEQKTRGRKLWKTIRPKINPPFEKGDASWLYKLVCAVHKRDYTKEQCELLATNPRKLLDSVLNKQLRVSTAHYTSKKGNKGDEIINFSVATEVLEPYVAPVKEETGIDKPLTQSTEEQQETVNDSELPF